MKWIRASKPLYTPEDRLSPDELSNTSFVFGKPEGWTVEFEYVQDREDNRLYNILVVYNETFEYNADEARKLLRTYVESLPDTDPNFDSLDQLAAYNYILKFSLPNPKKFWLYVDFGYDYENDTILSATVTGKEDISYPI